MRKGKFPTHASEFEKVSDEELVGRYLAGERTAGNVICHRYQNSLYRFFRWKTGKPEEAADLTQETWLEVTKSLKKGKIPENFRAWIIAISKCVLARWIKAKVEKRKKEVSMETQLEKGDGTLLLADLLSGRPQDCPEHSVLESELRDIRRRFEDSLPAEQVSLFRLRSTDNLSFKDIAAELGIKEDTARVRYHRTVKAFKEWLKEKYPDIYRELIARKGK